MAEIRDLFIGGTLIRGLLRFEQRMAFNKHTVVTLDIRYSRRPTERADVEIAPEWSPVTFDLGRRSWYGYVLSGGVASDAKDSTGSVIRYTVVGTSLPMNSERTEAYRSASASGIVRQVAARHRLRSVISPHAFVIDYYAQTGISDWRVLKEMSDRTGHRLWVDGSTVLFVDPKVLLDGVRDIDVPTYSQNFVPGMADSLRRFTSSEGTLVERAGGSTRRQVIYGLDPATGQSITAAATTDLGTTTAPLLTKVVSAPATSVDEARSTVSAAATRTRGWITATAEVNGSPDLVPGSVIDIDGTSIPSTQRGRWLVTGVTHRVIVRDTTRGSRQFFTELALERDKYRGPSFTSAFKVSNTAQYIPATMRNGLLWESERLEDVRVG